MRPWKISWGHTVSLVYIKEEEENENEEKKRITKSMPHKQVCCFLVLFNTHNEKYQEFKMINRYHKNLQICLLLATVAILENVPQG